MLPVKSEGSSCCKGKEAVVDQLPIKSEGGKEVFLFELEHSEEEGMAHDLDSECPPLIDWWYDVHSHFPMDLVTTCPHQRIVFGYLWSNGPPICLGHCCRLLSSILPFAVEKPCQSPFYLSSSQVHHWVGRIRLTMNFPM